MPYSAYHDGLTRQIAAESLPDNVTAAEVFYRMIRQECGNFNLDVIEGRIDSSAGARGIAQLMPLHWRYVDPLDPPAALRYGARLLADGLSRYHGNLRMAAASYNAGPGNVDDALRCGDSWVGCLPTETQNYLRIIFDEGGPLPDPRPEPPMSELYYDAATGWYLPASGPVTQRFGENKQDYPKSGGIGHPGIDIGAAYGADVRAVRRGRVTYAGWLNGDGLPIKDRTGYGLLVRITDEEGVEHWYGHLSETRVSLGDWVDRGQLVGQVGDTGRAYGAHLHYEIRVNGVITNPEPWLNLGAVLVYGTVSASDGINLRTEPRVADETFVETLTSGTRFAIAQDAWLPVIVNGRRGYVKAGDALRAWVAFQGSDIPNPPPPPPPTNKGRYEDLGGLRFQREAFENRAQKAGEAARVTKELSDELLFEAATIEEKVRQAEAAASEPQG